MASILLFLAGFALGAVALVLYGAWRATRSPGWDDSNVTNWIRLQAHTYMHPEDFGRMYYLTAEEQRAIAAAGFEPERPFWYIDKDEFAEVVRTRPLP